MKIEFIIPTYERTELLFTMVCSILAQTNPNWTIHIVGDQIPQPNLDRLKSFLNHLKDDRIKLTNLEQRHNDWGHTPRQYGVDNATSEWVVMTGEDNYYTPVFVDEVLKVITPRVHFIYTDMVHNWINKQYYPIKTQVEFGKIDMGCYITKTKNAKQIRLKTDQEWADWYFVEDYLKKFPDGKIIKIEKVLYVHN